MSQIAKLSEDLEISYLISTPTKNNATQVDPSVPTVVYLHSIFMIKLFWHPQLVDPRLRRFNALVYDIRGHGSTIAPVNNTSPNVCANDLVMLLDHLKLDKVYLAGGNLGSSIAQQFIIDYPDRCLGAFLTSPVPSPDIPEVTEGRYEICDCYELGFTNNDIHAMADALRGCFELSVSGDVPELMFLMLPDILINMKRNFSGTKGTKNINMKRVTVEFFSKVQPWTREQYSNIKCPVLMAHFRDDVAYPPEITQAMVDEMVQAGVDAKFHQFHSGPHFGSLSHPHLFNPLLEEFILSTDPTLEAKCPVPKHVTSPWADVLAPKPEEWNEFESVGHFERVVITANSLA